MTNKQQTSRTSINKLQRTFEQEGDRSRLQATQAGATAAAACAPLEFPGLISYLFITLHQRGAVNAFNVLQKYSIVYFRMPILCFGAWNDTVCRYIPKYFV